MTGRRIILTVVLLLGLAASAQAQVPVIVQIAPLGNVTTIAASLGGTILDQIPGTGIYLLNLPIAPSSLTSLLSPITGQTFHMTTTNR